MKDAFKTTISPRTDLEQNRKDLDGELAFILIWNSRSRKNTSETLFDFPPVYVHLR